jgi:outer membrane protein OmpA-like peptidoglycan-associated protein
MSIAVAAAVILGAGACARNAQRGAVIGGAGGAVVGGVIGAASGSTAKGAIIGAAVGGAAGAIIGDQMDRRAAELRQDIPGAKVERVGEGILVTFDTGLLFGYDSAVVRPAAQTNLRNLATNLDKYPDTDLLIVGHTDSTGTESYNLALSKRRAMAVSDYLAAQGVARTRLKMDGRGELEPVASNATEDGRQQNRRVEVAIYASEATRQQAKQRTGEGS